MICVITSGKRNKWEAILLCCKWNWEEENFESSESGYTWGFYGWNFACWLGSHLFIWCSLRWKKCCLQSWPRARDWQTLRMWCVRGHANCISRHAWKKPSSLSTQDYVKLKSQVFCTQKRHRDWQTNEILSRRSEESHTHHRERGVNLHL